MTVARSQKSQVWNELSRVYFLLAVVILLHHELPQHKQYFSEGKVHTNSASLSQVNLQVMQMAPINLPILPGIYMDF
jgi:TRAP-type mannitol/chloroaromatic compound transport system permease small subunit